MGRRRTTVSIYEVPSYLRDANLAAYMLQFGDIVSATHDGMRGEWRFDIMLDMKTFYFRSQLVGGGRAQASRNSIGKETRLLALW